MVARKSVRLFLSLVIVATAAWIGSIVTYPAISAWYAELDKPFFNPPNWIFGPVWTVLYALIAVSLYKVWSAQTARSKRLALVLFGVQLALNTAWSVVFFGLQLPWAAVGVIFALWLAIALTMVAFWPVSRVATYLLVPYLAWVSFATALNISIALLNPPHKVTNYQECVRAPGSVILDSYPNICMTTDKKQFTNPDQRVAPPSSSTLSIPELSATVPLTSGIGDAYYSYNSATAEVYLTTTKLEDALSELKGGCTSGLHGLYVKREGGGLREQARAEVLCAPMPSDATRQIEATKDLLRAAISKAAIE